MEQKMARALDVAKYILQEGKSLSNLELQKTLYFVELDYQKEHNKSLIEDDFEAWQYGPVSREVYHKYRSYGASPIDKPEKRVSSKDLGLSEGEEETIKNSITRSNKQQYWDLVDISHREGGAWRKVHEEGKKNKIKKKDIAEEAKRF